MSVKNLSSAQLAVAIGVQRSGISHILSGRNKPSLDFVLKILESFPELNESWLLKGDGEMLKTNKSSIASKDTTESNIPSISDRVHGIIKEEEEAPYQKEKQIAYKKVVEKEEKKIEQALNDQFQSTPKLIQDSKSAAIKKVIQIITIFEDDSFKVYYPQ